MLLEVPHLKTSFDLRDPSEITRYLLETSGEITISDTNYPNAYEQQVFDQAVALLDFYKHDDSPLAFRIVLGKGCTRTLELIPTVGMGVTHLGWTDRHPYEVTKVISGQTLEIRPMKAVGGLKADAQVSVGGFCAHVHDQHSAQEWVISSDEAAPTIRIRRRVNGRWQSPNGERFSVGIARKFHDFNF